MGSALLSFFKFLFIGLNVILMLLGVASLAGGIYVAVAPQHYLRFTEIGAIGLGQVGLVRAAGYLLIAAGGAVMLISGLGLLAACKESACLYAVYAVIMMIAMGCELAALILGLIYRVEWERSLKNSIQEQITLRFDGQLDSADIFTAAMNTFQTEFDCCGLTNSSDFDSALNWNRTTSSGDMMVIPPACCYDYKTNSTCATMPTGFTAYASKGCWMRVEELMQRYSLILIIIAAVTFGIELFLIAFSICIIARIRSGYDLKK